MTRSRCALCLFWALVTAPAVLGPSLASALPVLGDDILVAGLDNAQYSPAVAYNSLHDEFLVVWENHWPGGAHDIYASRLAGDGTILSTFAVSAGANDRMQPDVAYDSVNDRYLVVWTLDYFGDGSDYDINGRLIPWSGPDPGLTEFSICSWTSSEWHPRVAHAALAGEYLVVWTSTLTPRTIAGRRVLADGTGFANDSWEIAPAAQPRDFPDVTYSLARNDYMVVWEADFGSNLNINGVVVAPDGTTTASVYIANAEGVDEQRPAVAACGQGHYVIAWVRSSGAQFDIEAVGFGGTGYLTVRSTSVNEIHPDVVCTGETEQWLVTWQQQYSSLTGPYGVWARTVDASDSMGELMALVAPGGGGTAEFTSPTAATDGVNYLVAWEHDREGTTHQDIHARLVRPNIFADGFEAAGTQSWSQTVP